MRVEGGRRARARVDELALLVPSFSPFVFVFIHAHENSPSARNELFKKLSRTLAKMSPALFFLVALETMTKEEVEVSPSLLSFLSSFVLLLTLTHHPNRKQSFTHQNVYLSFRLHPRCYRFVPALSSKAQGNRSSPSLLVVLLLSLSLVSGFIGGTILSDILKQYPESTVTVQYRQDAHKDVLEKFSKQIVPVKGELRVLCHAAKEGGMDREEGVKIFCFVRGEEQL